MWAGLSRKLGLYRLTVPSVMTCSPSLESSHCPETWPTTTAPYWHLVRNHNYLVPAHWLHHCHLPSLRTIKETIKYDKLLAVQKTAISGQNCSCKKKLAQYVRTKTSYFFHTYITIVIEKRSKTTHSNHLVSSVIKWYACQGGKVEVGLALQVINRPGVAGAVLQTALWLIN